MDSFNHEAKTYSPLKVRDKRPRALRKRIFLLAATILPLLVSAHLALGTSRNQDRRPTQQIAKAFTEPFNTYDIKVNQVGLGAGDPQNIYISANIGYDIYPRLFRSSDGGDTWMELNKPPMDYPTYYFSPVTPGLLYATGAGLYASADYGATWSQISQLNIEKLVFHPFSNLIIYGICHNDVWRSLDAGKNWNQVFQPPLYVPYYLYNWNCLTFLDSISLDPNSPNLLFTAYSYRVENRNYPYNSIYIPGAMMRSTDCGDTWDPVNFPVDVHASSSSWIMIDPFPTGRMLARLSENIWKSEDNGMTWKQWGDMRNYSTVPPIPDPCRPGVLYTYYSPPQPIIISEDWGASFQTLAFTSVFIKSLAVGKEPFCYLYACINARTCYNYREYYPHSPWHLYKSSNKGKSWTKIFPHQNINIVSPQPQAIVHDTIRIDATIESCSEINDVVFCINNLGRFEFYINPDPGSRTFSWNWDTRYASAGEHTISVRGYKDFYCYEESNPITVKVENVKLSLTGRLSWEKSWIVRGLYAVLQCEVEKLGNLDIAKYQILADDSGVPETVVKEFTAEQVKGNSFFWTEPWASRKSRTYQVVALGTYAARVGISNIVTLTK